MCFGEDILMYEKQRKYSVILAAICWIAYVFFLFVVGNELIADIISPICAFLAALSVGLVALIVIYQPEIRKFLTYICNTHFTKFIENRRNKSVDKVLSFQLSGEGAEDCAVGADQNSEHAAVTALHQGGT